MPDNRRSRTVTQGVHRSPNRAMLRAVLAPAGQTPQKPGG